MLVMTRNEQTATKHGELANSGYQLVKEQAAKLTFCLLLALSKTQSVLLWGYSHGILPQVALDSLFRMLISSIILSQPLYTGS